MATVFDDFALIEYQDADHVRDRRQPMRHHDHRPALHQVGEAELNFLFGDRIQRRSRFVEYQDRRVLEDRARDGDPLPLTAGKLYAALANQRLVTLFRLQDEFMGMRLLRRLDDFRVAATSLGTFEQLPLDEIKIHASALRRAQQDRVALTVLAAVTGLAHNLGITVCAEGVENEQTYQFLRQIECDKMQGFLISEAVLPNIIRRVYSASENEDVA